jgi:hypothetical protein
MTDTSSASVLSRPPRVGCAPAPGALEERIRPPMCGSGVCPSHRVAVLLLQRLLFWIDALRETGAPAHYVRSMGIVPGSTE